MVLSVKNLVKSYRNKRAVDGVSFDVEKGQIFALLGPNGAGKTTTIKCILGFRKADSGEITINGSYSYLPEQKELYRYMTVERMVQTNEKISRMFNPKKAFELLEEFQIPLKEKIANLSHGMKTLAYLSLVLAEDVDLYLMDEPTWGLDPLMRNRVLELVRTIPQSGKSVFYTSHILSEVERIADVVAIMVKGRIVEMDNLDNLKEKYVACVVPRGEKLNGYLYKSTKEEDVYIVKKSEANGKIQPADFDMIFEALVKGVKV
ncbi:MAG: ABC transporter ATP-binding protein [Pseudothermotoga sp.]|uniref:ABC transporter ATP-binding protein n=1 Tax=Pseudothermotoga sp. TaxID=2033661 RepID=UPI000A9F5998|nr:ABC transporter ATP-binding protein [Pseudothermotoga sp.]HBT38722.1 ABC transporter ATP-binding protein [Pseudothermotoga sp.]HCO98235.1 ABC transporter ATP-binding protein [Pseudothermotoga sp.]